MIGKPKRIPQSGGQPAQTVVACFETPVIDFIAARGAEQAIKRGEILFRVIRHEQQIEPGVEGVDAAFLVGRDDERGQSADPGERTHRPKCLLRAR